VQGLDHPPELLLLNKIWPLRADTVRALSRRKRILFLEETVQSGSIAEHLLAALMQAGFSGRYEMKTLPNAFIPQCCVSDALHRFGLSPDAIREQICTLQEESR
jgi:1-deoxy-D-xylulose-5-phosphate synthase